MTEMIDSTFFQNYKTRYLSLFSYYSPKCFSFIDTSYFYVPGTTFHGSQVSPLYADNRYNNKIVIHMSIIIVIIIFDVLSSPDDDS